MGRFRPEGKQSLRLRRLRGPVPTLFSSGAAAGPTAPAISSTRTWRAAPSTLPSNAAFLSPEPGALPPPRAYLLRRAFRVRRIYQQLDRHWASGCSSTHENHPPPFALRAASHLPGPGPGNFHAQALRPALPAPFLADPLEPQNSLAVNPDTVDYYGSLGGSLEIFRESRPGGSAWSMGFLGEANLEIFRFSWASYRLGDIDLWAGAFVSESEGAFTNRLEFLHGVSHLGDWLFSASSVSSENFPALTAVPWERDGLQYLDSYRAGSLLRLYGGGGFWFSSTPAAPPLYLHAGMELTSGYFRTAGVPWRGYFAYDLQVGGTGGGSGRPAVPGGVTVESGGRGNRPGPAAGGHLFPRQQPLRPVRQSNRRPLGPGAVLRPLGLAFFGLPPGLGEWVNGINGGGLTGIKEKWVRWKTRPINGPPRPCRSSGSSGLPHSRRGRRYKARSRPAHSPGSRRARQEHSSPRSPEGSFGDLFPCDGIKRQVEGGGLG